MTSFDTQVQCEEFYNGVPQLEAWEIAMMIMDAPSYDSEDAMDKCECVSLDSIHNKAYQMDDIIVEDLDNDWLFDDFHLTHQERLDRMTIGKMRLM